MPWNEILALGCIASFFVLLFVGVPVALTLAISGFFFGWLGFGTGLFNLLPARIYGVTANYTLIAIPLFVFMGVMLEKSRMADELMEVIGHLSGSLRGGMGLGIVLVGVLMGATTGIVGATIVTLGLLTLPTLLRRGYDKSLACGTICASGTLGQLIPPSTILILLADILGESVGTLFAATVLPGLLLSAIFCAWIIASGIIWPEKVPPIPLEERQAMPRKELWLKVLKVGLPPIALVVAVLGSIIGGIAAPTEAASMGAVGSILVAAVAGRLTLKTLVETVNSTARITAMMFFILICSQVFALSFRGLGGERLVHDMFSMVPGGTNGILIFMLAIHLRARLLHRMDRDQLHRGADVPAADAVGWRRPRLGRGVDRDDSPDFFPHPTVRLGIVLPARRGASRGLHARHLQRRRAVHRVAADRADPRIRLPRPCHMAPRSHRLVEPRC